MYVLWNNEIVIKVQKLNCLVLSYFETYFLFKNEKYYIVPYVMVEFAQVSSTYVIIKSTSSRVTRVNTYAVRSRLDAKDVH